MPAPHLDLASLQRVPTNRQLPALFEFQNSVHAKLLHRLGYGAHGLACDGGQQRPMTQARTRRNVL